MLDRGVERRGPPKPAGPVARAVSTIGRMILPVAGLLGAMVVVWYLRAVPASDFRFLTQIDPSLDPMADHWLNWGLVLVPLSFFCRQSGQPALWACPDARNRCGELGLCLRWAFLGAQPRRHFIA
jgi:hypothetical protein